MAFLTFLGNMQNFIEKQESNNLLVKQNLQPIPKRERRLPIRFVDNKSVNLYSNKTVHNKEDIISSQIVFSKPIAVLRTSAGISLGDVVEVDATKTQKFPILLSSALKRKMYFRCEFCNNITKTKNDFIKHVKIHRNCILKCDNYEDTLERDFENHQKLRDSMQFCNSKSSVSIKTDVQNKIMHKDTKTVASGSASASINIIVGTNGQIQSIDTSLSQSSASSPENKYEETFAFKEGLNELKFACLQCFKEFNCHIAVRRHYKKAHTVARNFKCQECTATFKHKNNLDYHMAKHKNHRPFKCGECSKSFAVNYELVIHMRKHTGEKPYSCNICGKPFRHRCNLIVHQRLHSGTKPYECNICNANFNSSSHLKKHKVHHLRDAKKELEIRNMKDNSKPKKADSKDAIRIQNETPKESCIDDIKIQQVNDATILKNSFSCEDELNRYTEKLKKPTITIEKCEVDVRKIERNFIYKFQCPICFRYFKQKCALTRHHRTHTGEKPYNCAWCDKSFADPSNFKKHKITHIRDALFKPEENTNIELPECSGSCTSPMKCDLHIKCSQNMSYNNTLFSSSYDAEKNATGSFKDIGNCDINDTFINDLTTSKGPLIIWPDFKSNEVQPDTLAEIEKNEQTLLKSEQKYLGCKEKNFQLLNVSYCDDLD